jgi:hypothetical protein
MQWRRVFWSTDCYFGKSLAINLIGFEWRIYGKQISFGAFLLSRLDIWISTILSLFELEVTHPLKNTWGIASQINSCRSNSENRLLVKWCPISSQNGQIANAWNVLIILSHETVAHVQQYGIIVSVLYIVISVKNLNTFAVSLIISPHCVIHFLSRVDNSLDPIDVEMTMMTMMTMTTTMTVIAERNMRH